MPPPSSNRPIEGAPQTERVPIGTPYSAVRIGDLYTRRVTITEAHVSEGARLIGDFNPLHVDESFARASRFGGRILHGVITSALMGAELGMVYAGTALGYLEHNARFLAPVRIGDDLTITWTVVALEPKPRHGGGIVACEGVALNQHGVSVCATVGKMLVGERPSTPAA